MTKKNRVDGLGWLHSMRKTSPLVLGTVAIGNLGCATTIARTYPHLERRAVCVLPSEVEQDATEFVITDNNVPISNFHPETVEKAAAKVRTVFEYDPAAEPSSVRHLPAPYNELTCPDRFSMLPSKDAETHPLPKASLDLLVHEPRPEAVPQAVAYKLANCPSRISNELEPVEYTMSFNVYVTKHGQAVSASVAQSTLGDRKMEACIVDALRTTSWSPDAIFVTAPSAQPVASTVTSASKLFFAQPVPVEPSPDSGPISHVRPKLPFVEPPAGAPRGYGVPRIFVIPLGPLAAAGAVFGIVFFWPSDEEVPAWRDELNPITRQPYTSQAEYEAVRRLTPQQILQQQITNAKPNPAPAPPPAPTSPPATGPRRNPGQTCDDAVLDELEAAKKAACREKWSCSDTFENIGKKKEKLLTCPELLPRIAKAQACLSARQRVQTECYAGSPEAGHDGQIKNVSDGLQECIDKAAIRGPGGGPCH